MVAPDNECMDKVLTDAGTIAFQVQGFKTVGESIFKNDDICKAGVLQKSTETRIRLRKDVRNFICQQIYRAGECLGSFDFKMIRQLLFESLTRVPPSYFKKLGRLIDSLGFAQAYNWICHYFRLDFS